MPKRFVYDYPRPAVTVDLVAFALKRGRLNVLLIRRKETPYAGCWALPGGFLEMDEEPAAGALREVEEETGIALTASVRPLLFAASVDRDPRGRTISLVHWCTVRSPVPIPRGGDDTDSAAWVPIDDLGEPLAFDHDGILDVALSHLIAATVTGEFGLGLLPETFDLDDMRSLLRSLNVPLTELNPWRKQLEAIHAIERLPGRKVRYRAL